MTLNEIVEQYVRSDPLIGAVEDFLPAAAAGKSRSVGAWLEPRCRDER